MRPCWYKRDETGNWELGAFHQWSLSYDEFESGPGQHAAAIVEDSTGACHVVFAGHVSFSETHPDGKPCPLDEEPYESSFSKAAREWMDKQGKDIGVADWVQKGGSILEWLKEKRKPKPWRFEPRLKYVGGYSRWLVQVHPETIEVFTHDQSGCEYVCQVRWIGGEMDYTQGGLPLAEIEDMFMEANR